MRLTNQPSSAIVKVCPSLQVDVHYLQRPLCLQFTESLETEPSGFFFFYVHPGSRCSVESRPGSFNLPQIMSSGLKSQSRKDVHVDSFPFRSLLRGSHLFFRDARNKKHSLFRAVGSLDSEAPRASYHEMAHVESAGQAGQSEWFTMTVAKAQRLKNAHSWISVSMQSPNPSFYVPPLIPCSFHQAPPLCLPLDIPTMLLAPAGLHHLLL